jgi:ubiquinone/menaquinone biosynthesis C-methylase UbiE
MTDELLRWQRDVWDTIATTYENEIVSRFQPCTVGCLKRMALADGDRVLDLGCGTGSLLLHAAKAVGTRGHVTAVDISEEMLDIARHNAYSSHTTNITFMEGRAEKIPVRDASHNVLAASLSLMFVLDKDAAAREIARVLMPGGRMVAAVWAPPERCDIMRFQKTVGMHAPEPPVKGVGPATMANPAKFLELLARHGIEARVEEGACDWSHPNLQHTWDTFAAVTAERMSEEQIVAAREAIKSDMWPEPDSPRKFKNTVLYIVGTKR